MIRFPSQYQDGEGVITEVLGPRGTPGVDTLSIIREFGLPEEFAADALDEARLEAEKFDESIGPGRTDLTGEVIITIDPVDARDFDDAISLVRIEKGHWRLGVHIADVSHFVRPRTALDREAMHRGTSVYLPDRVLPMLPELISNGLASLQPDRVRYTKTVFIEFTPEGIPVGVDAANSAIRSRRRFAYEEIDEYLADPAPWREKLTPEVHGLVGRMHELAMILRQRRLARGALELTMREVKIDLDRQGQVAGAHLVENTVSHQIIEEFMLAANEAVAELLNQRELHFLRRVHQAPDPRKLKALTEFVAGLGLVTDSLESRFELQRLLYAVVGQPAEHAVNYAVLRSLQRAIYSPQVEGHYALASEHYCHFTSPIRRYPDLTIHRLLDAVLTGKKPHNEFGELAILGEHCSDRERRAEAAEARADQGQIAQLSQHPDWRAARGGGDRRRRIRSVRARDRIAGRRAGSRFVAARRLLSLRPGLAHAGGASLRQQLPPGRPGFGERRPGGRRPPRARFPDRRPRSARSCPAAQHAGRRGPGRRQKEDWRSQGNLRHQGRGPRKKEGPQGQTRLRADPRPVGDCPSFAELATQTGTVPFSETAVGSAPRFGPAERMDPQRARIRVRQFRAACA